MKKLLIDHKKVKAGLHFAHESSSKVNLQEQLALLIWDSISKSPCPETNLNLYACAFATPPACPKPG